MHIAHVQGTFSPEHGGPTKSLTNYCRSQVKAGHRVGVWALEGFPDTSPAVILERPIEMHVCRASLPTRLGRSPELCRQLAACDTPDLFHVHGVWLRALQYGADEALQRRRPYLVELMGTYEPWSLRHKWLQKRVARWWYQDRLLNNAACLHVNSRQEAEHLRTLGFQRPIAIIPVGVDLTEIAEQNLRLPQAAPWPQLTDRQYILYLSRLHPKKRLDLLIRSWSKIAPLFPDCLFVIAGTGEQTYIDECHKIATDLGVAEKCVWTGHVNELQKNWLYSHAHCYVLPTFSENFGNTVAEALAHKTPVITTHHTPWVELPKYHCGWLVDNSENQLSDALTEAMNISPAARRQMGENGELLVRDYFSLERVCKDILEVYSWLVNGEPKPDCILG